MVKVIDDPEHHARDSFGLVMASEQITKQSRHNPWTSAIGLAPGAT
jgi:hypothetical protein